jgi:ABC-2 type transport system permease protein
MSVMNGAGAATLELPAPVTDSPALAALRAPAGARAPGTGWAGEARTGFRAMQALLRMSLIEQRRYMFNSVVRMVTVYAFFLMLFMGARVTLGASAGFGGTLSSLVVGMLVFMMAQRAYQDHSTRLNGEAMQGTLEQLAMSRVGLAQVLVYNMMVMTIVQLCFNAVFLVLMMATTGQWLHLDLLSIVPLLLLATLSVHGVGMAMGGLTLLFKRVGATAAIFQYVFLMLVAVPVEKFPAFAYLPLSYGSGLIRRVMVDGQSLYRMPAGDVLFLLANSAAYFAAGLLIFKLCERIARDRGALGHY